MALGAELNLNADNWHWVLCLTLPLKTLDVLQFSPRPYKWIRYAIGIVVGAVGDLSSSSDSLNIVDYNAGLPAESVALYTPATTRGEECSRPILTSRAQRSLLVLPLLEGLNSVPKLQSGMVTNAS